MFNYPYWYVSVSSYSNPSTKTEPKQYGYKQQVIQELEKSIELFRANNAKVEQLDAYKYKVLPKLCNQAIVVSIYFHTDKFKSQFPSYWYQINCNKSKALGNEQLLTNILLNDKQCLDLEVLQHKGKHTKTKLLITNSTNSLIIEDEFDEVIPTNLLTGDIIYKLITTNCLVTNINAVNSLKIISLVNCYYQPKQIITKCNDVYLSPLAILDKKGDKYLLTTEEENYSELLEAYNSVLGCCRKFKYANLQYSHIEYVDLV